MGQTGVANKDDVQDLKVHIDTQLEALKEAMEKELAAKLASEVESLKEILEGIIIFFGLFGK
jgi:hypothetical protein